MGRHKYWNFIWMLGLAAACAPSDRDGSGDDSGITGGSGGDSDAGDGDGDGDSGSGDGDGDSGDGDGDGDSGDGDGDGDSGGGDGDGDGDSGIRLDVGDGGGTGPGEGGECDPSVDEECGCTMVDVLFVIDNSGTMCSKQQQLGAAFPTFVDAMYDALPGGTDLHVGITTSGFELGGSHGESNCAANEPQATIDQYYTRPTEGMVAGNGLQGRLYEHDGMNYYAVDTGDAGAKDGLKDWFSAAASGVGCSVSSFEFNASGAAWALHPENAANNAGFLRDEGAALVIFILSDEGDQSLDMETLDFLHDTVVQAKSGCGGDACVIPGGILTPFCGPGQSASVDFLNSFGKMPIIGDIGTGFGPPPDWSGTLGDAFASVVAETCQEIPPPVG